MTEWEHCINGSSACWQMYHILYCINRKKMFLTAASNGSQNCTMTGIIFNSNFQRNIISVYKFVCFIVHCCNCINLLMQWTNIFKLFCQFITLTTTNANTLSNYILCTCVVHLTGE